MAEIPVEYDVVRPMDGGLPKTTASAASTGFLFGPKTDFFCLGGGSLIVIPVFGALIYAGLPFEYLALATMIASHFINNPHFAHSYQIFYRQFGDKLTRPEYSNGLRVRYFVSGVLVPVLLTLFFTGCIIARDVQTLALAANLMLFLVGWHYVKQGYGMLILDSVLKRRFFSDFEKRVFQGNAYACWIFYWLLANWTVAEQDFAGLRYYMFDVPEAILYVAGAAAVFGSVLSSYVLYRKWVSNGRYLPVNGVVAYAVTLYVWLFLRLDPAFLLLIPALHSLQYLAVVWRFQINSSEAGEHSDKPSQTAMFSQLFSRGAVASFVGFVSVGIVLGFAGFWLIPATAETLHDYDSALFGGTLYFFVFWIFINVHHYFLDTVMWRRGNPEIQKHLFSGGASAGGLVKKAPEVKNISGDPGV